MPDLVASPQVFQERDDWTPETNPVLNSPYEEPKLHWSLDTLNRAVRPLNPGRRESLGILSVPEERPTTTRRKQQDQAQQSLDLPIEVQVNDIRDQVRTWRLDGYPGATHATRQLLHYWHDSDREHKRLFFAQLEALETLVFLTEVDSPTARSAAEDVQAASGKFNEGLHRLAVKMATGTGKTVVMGMVIVWHAVNRYRAGGGPNLNRYQRNFLVIAPGLTVRDRLAVLVPGSPDNVYDDMGLLPPGLAGALSQVQVAVRNFHRLKPGKRFSDLSGDAKRLLKGRNYQDEFVTPAAMWREELRGMHGLSIFGEGGQEKVCVLNDEAHHCYQPGSHTGAEGKEEDKKAAIWFSALKLLRDENLLGPIYDFSATPMFIETSARRTVQMFPWVVSDFPLLDAIESGLVKIPRVPVSDDADHEEVEWRHLFKYSFLDSDGNPTSPKLDRAYMPTPLVKAIDALYGSYEKTYKEWEDIGRQTPPVFIVVANTVANAEVLYRYLSGWVDADGAVNPAHCELFSNQDEVHTLLVHSKMEDEGEIASGLSKNLLLKEQADRLRGEEDDKRKPQEIMRDALNTVGRLGGRGEKVRCVVSVSMLTEGWDTRTVTHILGFRPFGTQLLCEQVTGRALRRVEYDLHPETGLLPHYPADVLGVPFNFVAPIGDVDPTPPPEVYDVYTMAGRSHLRLEFPVVEGYTPSPTFVGINFDLAKASRIDEGADQAVIAGIVGEEDEVSAIPTPSDRRQSVLAESAAALVRLIVGSWDAFAGEYSDRVARRTGLFQNAFQVMETWFDHHNVFGDPELAWLTTKKRANYIAQRVFPGCEPDVPDHPHVWLPRYPADRSHQLIDTFGDGDPGDMVNRRYNDQAPGGRFFPSSLLAKYPATEARATNRSELNRAACDSAFEAVVAELLDHAEGVQAWVRNYKLGWCVPYTHEGRLRHYYPDFVARIGGEFRDPAAVHLVVEVKGEKTELSEVKKRAVLDRWIPAVEISPDTPDWLRYWQFVELSDQPRAEEDLGAAIAEAQRISELAHRVWEPQS